MGVLKADTYRKAMETPAIWIPPSKAFKPQKMIRMKRDVHGWAGDNKLTRKQYWLRYGREYAMDEEKARDFVIKGYAIAVGWEVKTTPDEIDDVRGHIKVVDLGLQS